MKISIFGGDKKIDIKLVIFLIFVLLLVIFGCAFFPYKYKNKNFGYSFNLGNYLKDVSKEDSFAVSCAYDGSCARFKMSGYSQIKVFAREVSQVVFTEIGPLSIAPVNISEILTTSDYEKLKTLDPNGKYVYLYNGGINGYRTTHEVDTYYFKDGKLVEKTVPRISISSYPMDAEMVVNFLDQTIKNNPSLGFKETNINPTLTNQYGVTFYKYTSTEDYGYCTANNIYHICFVVSSGDEPKVPDDEIIKIINTFQFN